MCGRFAWGARRRRRGSAPNPNPNLNPNPNPNPNPKPKPKPNPNPKPKPNPEPNQENLGALGVAQSLTEEHLAAIEAILDNAPEGYSGYGKPFWARTVDVL